MLGDEHGMCSLDHFLELSYLNDLLVKAELKQVNRTWNKVQVNERDHELSFVENAVLGWGDGGPLHEKKRNTSDGREDVHKKRLGWVSELWKSRLVTVNLYWCQLDICIDASWNDKSYSALSSNSASVKSLLEALLAEGDLHIHLTGIQTNMASSVVRMLYPMSGYIFNSLSHAKLALLNTLVCNPQQRFSERFSVYFPGYTWETTAKGFGCNGCHCGVWLH